MPVKVLCSNPDCDASYSVTPENLGRSARCKKCGRHFTLEIDTRADREGEESDADWLPPPDLPTEPGIPERIGRYRIVRKLGEGGMGVVYLAHDTGLDRPVALKVPHFGSNPGPETLQRFYREARAAAGFDHPNLCPVYDVGQADGVHYLSMPYIEGEPLSSLLANGPLPDRRAAEVVRTLARALAEAHGRGVIHRDLKPSNIMVSPRRELVIMDFGLARRDNAGEQTLTRTGAVMGTPAYMAPEQVRGDIRAMGPRTDIYSLGVILFELSTGRRPFEGHTHWVLSQIDRDEPTPPSSLRPGLSPRLEAICLRAMAKQPDDRYPSMEALAADLTEFLLADPAIPPPRAPDPIPRPRPAADPPPPSRPRRNDEARPPRSNRRRVVLVAALVLLLGTILSAFLVKDLSQGVGEEASTTAIGTTEKDPQTTTGLPETPPGTSTEPPVILEKTAEQPSATSATTTEPPPPAAVSKPPPVPSEKATGTPNRSDAKVVDSKEAARLKTETVSACINRGLARQTNGDIDGAIAEYDQAIRNQWDCTFAYFNRGICYYNKRDYEKALADHDEAIRLGYESAPAYYGRGIARQANGDIAGAIADYTEAIRRDPHYTPAINAIRSPFGPPKSRGISTTP